MVFVVRTKCTDEEHVEEEFGDSGERVKPSTGLAGDNLTKCCVCNCGCGCGCIVVTNCCVGDDNEVVENNGAFVVIISGDRGHLRNFDGDRIAVEEVVEEQFAVEFCLRCLSTDEAVGVA